MEHKSKCKTNADVCKLVSEKSKLQIYRYCLEKIYIPRTTNAIYTGLSENMNKVSCRLRESNW
jgi:hypothetical protein